MAVVESLSGFYDCLRWYLVDQPTISDFHWQPGPTLFASHLSFATTAVISYLSLTLLLHFNLLPLPSIPPPLLKFISALHNLFLLSISILMATGCALSSAFLPSPKHLFCFPPNTSSSGSVFYWTYIFYLSKLYELFDTLLILLARDKRRLTFLHVYHHALVIVMCYVWLSTSQSLVPIALVTNATVHVVMYAYYFSCSVGLRWPARWKRVVTEVQICQFVFSFAASVVFLWYHFAGGGCEGINGWLFNAVFNASLLILFLNFHTNAYKGRKNKNEPNKKQ
ncbi:Elongation of very long chain fatty acids protein 5 [Rhynchospora pubera]|uniref:very-long-chain 3-oxoacyl-CoA synthase n=1 Tax=Rhynchospora pubera TaxID=906938 RepID=A0AAV8D7U4_9POAL|nr:Elongation of very long chain fatty acids protein 5 [Rhynchospora pubera]KAJ4762735.1 Elongation of very long chain fatty acids protein 5 [Rhynchospora pubera]